MNILSAASNSRIVLKSRATAALCLLTHRKISTLEARRFMQIPDGVQYPSKAFNEDMLKKQYLKLAKVYHPDAKGTAVGHVIPFLIILSTGKISETSRGLFKAEGGSRRVHTQRG